MSFQAEPLSDSFLFLQHVRTHYHMVEC